MDGVYPGKGKNTSNKKVTMKTVERITVRAYESCRNVNELQALQSIIENLWKSFEDLTQSFCDIITLLTRLVVPVEVVLFVCVCNMFPVFKIVLLLLSTLKVLSPPL